MSDLYIGLMSGTSTDGLDGVLADFGQDRARVLHAHGIDFPDPLRQELLALNRAGADEIERAARAALVLSQLAADVVAQLLRQAALPPERIAAIGLHGHTVRHRPEQGFTVQIAQPAALAERTGIAVVADFRSRDVAAGGQGAPLVPAFHQAVLGQPGVAVAVLNLGGIANVSLLDAEGGVRGWDTGPANVLMDLWCERHTGQRFDRDGAWAASGRVSPALLQTLLAEPYFARTGVKSTGRELFNADWLQQRLDASPDMAPQDVQATLLALTVETAARGLDAGDARQVWVCGGGARNAALMAALARRLPQARVQSSDEAGWPAQQMEAAAFAWLARQALRGRAGNLPSVTGAQGPRVLGAIYPA